MTLREQAMEALCERRQAEGDEKAARMAKEWEALMDDIGRWQLDAQAQFGEMPDNAEIVLKCNWDELAEEFVDEVAEVLPILYYEDGVCLHPWRAYDDQVKLCWETRFSLAWKCPKCGGAVIQDGYIESLADLGAKLEQLAAGALKACEHDCVPDSVLQAQKAKSEPEGWVRIRVDSATWQMVKALRRMIEYSEGV
jgi:hypothetical protein